MRMAAEDVALALITLDNEQARWEVEQHDFSRFDAFDLSAEERALLTGATLKAPRQADMVAVAVNPDDPPRMRGPGGPERGFGYWPAGTAEAIAYVQRELTDPRLQASFLAWQETRGDRFP
jgi:hypothetical protein